MRSWQRAERAWVALGGVGGGVPHSYPHRPPQPSVLFLQLCHEVLTGRMDPVFKSCDCGFCRVALIFNGDSHPSPDHTKTLYVIRWGLYFICKM